jgi:hypothetical protein
MTKLHTHCGCCSQCLDRRFAILSANAAEHDPVEMYKVELLTGARTTPNDQTMAESYVRTALELREAGELAFFGRFGGESARVFAGTPTLSADEVGRRVFDLHKRHVDSIGSVLKGAIESHSEELVKRSLPASSLLMITVRPDRPPEFSPRSQSRGLSGERMDLDAETAAGEPRKVRRRKSQPALERARRIIVELYPDGVPQQAMEPNVALCRRVSSGLKASKLLDVSDDTILRAAGRRK